ncbi:MAG: hypothetical protein SPL05_07540 [Eubacteriales bacterium]|nr:hypothetical protein [Eubacteriales bacterium]
MKILNKLFCFLIVLLCLQGASALAAMEQGDATSKLSPEEYKMFDPDFWLTKPRNPNQNIKKVTYVQYEGKGPIMQIATGLKTIALRPKDKVYMYYTVTGSQHTFNNTPRIGFHADYQRIAKNSEGKYVFDKDRLPLELKNFRADGAPSDLWEGLDKQLIPSTSTDPNVARHGYKVQGKDKMYEPRHVPFGFNFDSTDKHYISFEFTVPEDAHYVVWAQGSGSSGQSGGVISATADGIWNYMRTDMQFHYVLDEDYRKNQNISGEEESTPLLPRAEAARYKELSTLKALAAPSQVYTYEYLEPLFPMKADPETADGMNPYNSRNFLNPDTGAVERRLLTMFHLQKTTKYYPEKPTYASLQKEIPGYEYVANDLERYTYKNNPNKPAEKYFDVGPKNEWPMFNYYLDPDTGELHVTKHFYFTYKKLPSAETTPPAVTSTPTLSPTPALSSTPTPALSPTPLPPAPKTGDSQHYTLWLLLALSTALSIGVIQHKKKHI